MIRTKLHSWFGFGAAPSPVVPVLKLFGVIQAPRGGGGPGMGRSINLDAVKKPLKRALDMPNVSALAVVINSPGGSPAQSSLVANAIRNEAARAEVPVYAFCEDVAASGGMLLACGASDKIYANPYSVIGSIGVVTGGFGAVDLINKVGLERRLMTAGNNKVKWDAFKPEDPDDVAKVQRMLDDIHKLFINDVKTARGDKLVTDAVDENGDPIDLFSGDVWLADKALELGLIDGIGDIYSVMRKEFGDDVEFKDVQKPGGFFGKLSEWGAHASASSLSSSSSSSSIGADMGAAMTRTAVDAVEEAAIWSRVPVPK